MPVGLNLPAFPSPYSSSPSSPGEEGSSRAQDNNHGSENNAASGTSATGAGDAAQYRHAGDRRGKILVGGDPTSPSSRRRKASEGRPGVFTEDSAGGCTSRPIPKVNVSAQFERINLSTSPPTSVFQYLNSSKGHGLCGVIDPDGKLGFDIKAQGDRSVLGTGRDMFISLMQHLEEEGIPVLVIEGKWNLGPNKHSDNTAEYQKNLDEGMSPEDAAKNTWTGRMVKEFGFSVIHSVREEVDAIKVLFEKEDAQKEDATTKTGR